MDVQLSGDAAECENKKGPSIQKMPRPFPRLRDDCRVRDATASLFLVVGLSKISSALTVAS
jgi:hypothetical protein